MDYANDIAQVVGRLLVSVLFIASGFGLINQSEAAHDLEVRRVPHKLVRPLILGGRAIEIVGGLVLALGLFPLGAPLVLLAFLVLATLVSPTFWPAESRESSQARLKGFFSNLAIAGALIYLAAAGPQLTWS